MTSCWCARAGVASLVAIAISVAPTPLASEGVAQAAVTPQFSNNTLTLTGDGTAETVTLAVSGANVTHNLAVTNLPGGGGLADNTDFDPGPGKVTVPNTGSVNLVVNVGAGNDNVNVSDPSFAGTPVINGGDGDDTIVGSAALDAVDGGPGNDRITAFRGNDTITGSTGNDVIIWNNGDGSDLDDGGAGADETLIVTGTADDLMTVDQVALTTRFARSNAPFAVEMRAVERLSVSSAAGNDRLASAPDVPVALAIDAGPGDDTVTTGAGADDLAGGDGNDLLSGGAGVDELAGGRGDDVLNGGAGDDHLLWSEGDGSDAINGDDGLDRVEAETSASADTLTLKLEGGRVHFDRPGSEPFASSIASSEVLALNTLGGNDSLVASPGVSLALIADGGAGDDRLTGGDASDTLTGGTGDDQLEGGAGTDVVDGGEGQDSLALRDGEADVGRGGPGTDSAVADAPGLDTIVADVERVERPPLPPDPSPPPPPSSSPPPAATGSTLPLAQTGGIGRIRMTFRAGWTVFDQGVRLESLTLKNLIAGTRIEMSCSVCRRKQTFTAKGSSLRLRDLPSRALRRGQRLVLTATKPDTIGHQIILTVKRYGHTRKAVRRASAAPFLRKDRCLPANSVKPQATC
jgi:Ca2+-binding RTX toxin-like protein